MPQRLSCDDLIYEEEEAATNHFLISESSDELSESQLCTAWRLSAICCTIWGMQLVWSVVFSRGTAYLLSLGIPKTATPLLWIAGPLCGMIVQPIAGIISDDYHPRLGYSRRKPFILGGALATAVSMIGLASIEETVTFLTSTSHKASLRLVLAFLWVYALNVSIQPLQGGIRTMLFESCPPQQQLQAASWYSITTAVGNVSGYLLGSLSLRDFGMPGLQSISQFQALCVIIPILLLMAASITCICADENDFMPSKEGIDKHRSLQVVRAIRANFECLASLPAHVIVVFQIQFFAWLGWFPVVYYQTTYLVDLYMSGVEGHVMTKTLEIDATHKASIAALFFAIVAFLGAICLAVVVPGSRKLSGSHRFNTSHNLTLLTNIWLFGHMLFTGAMLCTVFVSTIFQGTILVATIGISWTLSSWVPFAIIGTEIARLPRRAGTVSSLHNAAIAAPQIVAAVLCLLLFLLSRLMGRSDNTVWAMWMAGIAAIVAAWRTLCLRRLFASVEWSGIENISL